MTKTHYSPSVGGFLDSALWKKLPKDAIELKDDEHAAFMTGQASGKIIVHDGKGLPKLVEPPKPDPWVRHQARARKALDDSRDAVLASYEAGEPVPEALRAYRAALRAIVAAPSGDASKPLPVAP